MTSLSEELAEFNELCRVCANKTNVLLALNIFEGDRSNRAIYKKINKCLPITVSMDDKLPKLICEECVYKLDLLNEFQDISSKTEVFLTNLLNRIFLTSDQNTQSILGVPCSNLVPINIINHVMDEEDPKGHETHSMDSGPFTDLDSSQLGDNIGLKLESSNRDRGSKEMENITYIVTAEPLEGATFFYCVLCSKTFGDRNTFDGHCADAHWNKCVPCGLLFTSQDAYAMHCADIHMMDKPSTDVSFILSHMESYRQLPQNIPLTPILANGNLVGAAFPPGSSLAPNELPTITFTSASGRNDVPALEQLERPDESAGNTTVLSTSSNEPNTDCSSEHVGEVERGHLARSHSELSPDVNNSHVSTNVTNSAQGVVTNAFESVDSSSSRHVKDGEQGSGEEDEEGGRERLRGEEEEEEESSCDGVVGGMSDFSEDDSDDLVVFDETKLNADLKIQDPFKEQTQGDPNRKAKGQKKMLKVSEQPREELSTQPTEGLSKTPPTEGRSQTSTEGRSQTQRRSKQRTEGPIEPQMGLPEKPSFKCPLCSQQFVSKQTYESHVSSHGTKFAFQCSTCNKQFRSKIGLDQHEAKHSGQFRFECDACGKGFQSKSYLIVHQRVHSSAREHACNTCGRAFKAKSALRDHMNRHLGVKPFQCQTCGRGFVTKGLCKSHEKVHSGSDNRQYPCPVCQKRFVSKSYLSTHVRIHTGDKPFICEYCKKGFLTKIDLRIHRTMHTGEKAFVCETCGKAFARRDALRCHTRSHTGERPYKCNMCGQSFTQFTPMTIHKRLHTGERPYPCDVCEMTFMSRTTMVTHRKKHHKEET